VNELERMRLLSDAISSDRVKKFCRARMASPASNPRILLSEARFGIRSFLLEGMPENGLSADDAARLAASVVLAVKRALLPRDPVVWSLAPAWCFEADGQTPDGEYEIIAR
jgi:hypothetical protein